MTRAAALEYRVGRSMRPLPASLVSVTSVFATVLCSVLSMPASAGAQVLARSTVCGTEITLERSAGGMVTLTGASEGSVLLGAGDGALESVTFPRGAALVATVRADGAPVAAALVHCPSPGAVTVRWHGVTTWQGEDIGRRVRDELALREVNGRRTAVVGQRDETLELVPGVRPLVRVRALDPATGRLVPTVLDPRTEPGVTLPPARAVVAEPGADRPAMVPLRGLAAATGGTDDDRAGVLADRNPATGLTMPPGALVVASARAEGLTVRGVDLVARTGSPLPRHWTVFIEPGPLRLEVEVPPALSMLPRVHIPLGPEARVSRLALVAGEGSAGLPPAALGDIELLTDLDDPGADPYARLAERAAQPAGDDAATLLISLGDLGVGALLRVLPTMHGAGARRAVRLLGTVRRPGVAEALVTALGRAEVTEPAAAALRSQGEAALAPLSAVAATEPRAAAILATLAVPLGLRLRAVLPALEAEGAAWSAARPAVAGLVRGAAGAGLSDAWLAMLPRNDRAASRALALAAREFTDAAAKAAVAVRARRQWAEDRDFADRYRLLSALGGDPEGRDVLQAVATGDSDADLRAEALRALGTLGGAQSVVARALADRAPRVRAAAAGALRSDASTRSALTRALAGDPWPSVRAAAAGALAGDVAGAPALMAALDQASFSVVEAALRALGSAPAEATGVTARLVAYVDDRRRNPDLRREAAEALGARCDPASAAALVRLAEALSDPALPQFEQDVGHAVMAALARTDPVRARAFVTHNGSNAAAVTAVEAAIRTGCRPSAPTAVGNPAGVAGVR